jgi:hypothetical protein
VAECVGLLVVDQRALRAVAAGQRTHVTGVRGFPKRTSLSGYGRWPLVALDEVCVSPPVLSVVSIHADAKKKARQETGFGAVSDHSEFLVDYGHAL